MSGRRARLDDLCACQERIFTAFSDHNWSFAAKPIWKCKLLIWNVSCLQVCQEQKRCKRLRFVVLFVFFYLYFNTRQ